MIGLLSCMLKCSTMVWRQINFLYMSVLGACGKIGASEHGKLIHRGIIESGLDSDVVVGNTLIDMYAKLGILEEAHKVFEGQANQDVVSWGAIIWGYAQHGHGFRALKLFEKMQSQGTKPNKVIFLCVLRACASIEAMLPGQLIHGDVIRSGLESDPVVGSVIIDMYAKCASLREAHKVFDSLASKNVVSWCALIVGYIQYGQVLSAIELFGKMQQEGTLPNEFIFSSILKACGSTGDLAQAKLIHDHIIRCGAYLDDIIGNTLVDMYCQCGDLNMARKVFDKLVDQNLVSWGTMIFGYVQHGHIRQALELFKEMQWQGLSPNVVTFSCILKACGSVGAIDKGKLVHEQMMRSGLELDSVVGSILIDMYATCGFLDEAHRVFEKLSNRDAAAWGVLIAGYAEHGDCKLVGQCFEDMLEQGVKPDGKIYTSILVACTHAGKIEEGRQYFKSMVEDHGIVPSVEHSNSMADLLGRAGHLVEAEKLLLSMPMSVDIMGWTSLLSACRIYGNVDIGRRCFDQIVSLVPGPVTVYVLMSSIYADAQMWEKVYQIQELRKYACLWKTARFDDMV